MIDRLEASEPGRDRSSSDDAEDPVSESTGTGGNDAAEPGPKNAPADDRRTGVRSVLVVEDDGDLRDVIVEMLRQAGYHVREAGNGEEALHLFGEHTPEAVITDIVMPDSEGIELINRLTRHGAAPAIVAMSAHHGRIGGPYLQLAERMGADGVLRKPFKSGELLEAVAAAITKRDRRDAGDQDD